MLEKLKLTVILENSTSLKNLDMLSRHGLSMLVEAKPENNKEITVLMDTGPSAEVFFHNVNLLGLNLSNVDIVFLSHGHYDHTTGLLEALKGIGKTVTVIAHPKIFNPKFDSRLKYIGIPFKPSDIENAGGKLLLAKNIVSIAEGITTTGEIERTVGFEEVKGFYTVEDEIFKKDEILDDQALIFTMRDEDLVVLTGCGHAGVSNTIKHAQKLTGKNRVRGILGGFHLAGVSDERLKATIEELAVANTKIIGSCHCTGMKATVQLSEKFPDTSQTLQTGDIIEI